MTKISQKRFLQMELEKCQSKIKRDAIIIGGLKNTIQGHEELDKIYSGCIAALSAQVAGGQVPIDGTITIPRSELQEAMRRQALSTHYDKETDSFIIDLKIVEGGSTDDNSNGEGQAISEGNNDSTPGEDGEVEHIQAEDESRSSEAPES